MSALEPAVAITDVHAAAERIAPHVHRTPVLTSRALDERAGRRLFFKCENFQRIGAFKIRGATNAVLSLSDEAAARGVVTHSSGNHAQALALAAGRRGIDAHIVMPETSLAIKQAAVAEYGGRIHLCAPTLEARETKAEQLIAEFDSTFVHPYDDPAIIAGQGTCALELLDDARDLDAVIAPVGGGGLLSGTTIACGAATPAVRVFAAEPKGADDAYQSLAAGKLIPQTDPRTIADGLLTSLGDLTWPIIRDGVERVITVGEDEIVDAMRLVGQRMKIVIEPSAAVAVAAVLSAEFRGLGELGAVGVILSGGNVDLWP